MTAMLPNVRRPAIALAHRLGMPVALGPALPYFWNGTSLRIGPAMRAEGVTHEVAHWLLCPRKRRTVPEYGLGTVATWAWWQSDAPRAPLLVSLGEAEQEERLALMLGILYLGAIGRPWREAADTFHSCVCRGYGRCCEDRALDSLAAFVAENDDYADELRQRRLVAGDGLPIQGRLRGWRPAAMIR